ncbi:MAG: efflux RND transporter periplasmic adaptor subunit [Anaerolineae bacterium]|nr:efflux RND transporter periplasmic adaptor subunit [Thermoflexales bacterium]MDW8407596.1 efflux RND transporter periplasmic adaptor subunit [Anaerolineae bacterium]
MKNTLHTHSLSVAWAVALAIGIGLAGCAPANPPSATDVQRSATITRGTLVAVVNATGTIRPARQVRLAFETAGIVAEVNVKAGDTVKAGDVIAQLDATDLELALADAETALIIATTNYSRTVQGTRAADIRAAEAALRAAQANYARLKRGPNSADYAAIEAEFRNAEANLERAQNAYNKAFANDPATISANPAALQLEAATNAYNAAKARFERASQPAGQAELAAAWQQVESARANLERLKEPARAFDIDQALAQIEQARIQVEQARRRLAQTVLRAPADGVIANIDIESGEAVGQQPIGTLLDLSQLRAEITVDEIDVARIRPGQPVSLTLDALPGIEVTGVVERIAPASTLVAGVVSYEVRVLLDPTDQPLRPGMTANTSIVIDRRENALLVPNWAIRRDRQSGKSFLTVKTGEGSEAVAEVEVRTGLRNESFSEILSGVSEGQAVVAPRTPNLLGQ